MLVRTPAEIYSEYRIMPGLQMHQLRVAAVGKTVCDSLKVPIDSDAVVTACLFHDMGNIIKSDLTMFPEFFGEHDAAYWENVKKEYLAKYGTNEHHATIAIGKELGLPEKAITLMDSVGFTHLETTRDGASLEQKVVQYSDLRVAPHGVVSLSERLEEGRRRYEGRGHHDFPETKIRYAELVAAAEEIERQIFALANIKPDSITEESVQAAIAELRELPIGT